ncbi:venom nerve growth factor-like [Watersipora subatra]|uniref:venom nerve growth factor-like n=1 Tax=Watersipora subatra TaxID=2589382 RepID=UPI00355C27DD
MRPHKEGYLLILAMLAVTYSHPTHKHSDKHKEKHYHNKKSSRGTTSLSTDNLEINQELIDPTQLSPFVKFSKTKPTDSPWLTEEENEHNRTSDHRARRSTEHLGITVCDTVKEWTQPPVAKDFNGNTVQVMTRIDQDGATQLQYFYEIYCSSDEEPSCLGIDSAAYTSKCITKYIWVNAYVRNGLNQKGWSKIKIRGSCNCSIWRKSVGPTSIWDELLLRKR